jgi:predicted branched-subunit amino acid permease
MSTATEPDQSAFRLSLPVLFGYIPLGMAFGVLFSELGYHWLYAALMGLVIYAGACWPIRQVWLKCSWLHYC